MLGLAGCAERGGEGRGCAARGCAAARRVHGAARLLETKESTDGQTDARTPPSASLPAGSPPAAGIGTGGGNLHPSGGGGRLRENFGICSDALAAAEPARGENGSAGEAMLPVQAPPVLLAPAEPFPVLLPTPRSAPGGLQ